MGHASGQSAKQGDVAGAAPRQAVAMPLPVPFVTHPLTALQRAVLDVVVRGMEQRGAMPTPEDVAGQLGLASVATAEQLLAALERKGWLGPDAHGAGSSAARQRSGGQAATDTREAKAAKQR